MKRAFTKLLSSLLVLVMITGMIPMMSVVAAGYDAKAAVAYARKNYNNNDGTLCAGFVSNSLAAGGITIPNNAGYTYNTKSYKNNSGSLEGYTNPRTCSAAQLLYLSKKYTIIENPKNSDIELGDIVFMHGGTNSRWRDGHVGVVVKISNGKPLYAAHNKPAIDRYPSKGYTYVAKMKGNILSTLTAPKIDIEKEYYGGKTITITPVGNPAKQTIEYHRDPNESKHIAGTKNILTEATTSDPVKFNITTKEYIHGHAEASGYNNSKSTNKTFSVDKLATPVIKDPVYNAMESRVEITHADKNAIIIYTTDGSTPKYSTSSGTATAPAQKYNGAISVKVNMTIKAIAIKKGAATSVTATKAITVTTPDAPTAKLYQTEDKIAVGNTATVNWSSIAHTTDYEASLFKSGILIRTETTSGNLASFELPEVGVYEIIVKAKNFVGSSAPSIPVVTVEAMADVMVSFMDGDGITHLIPDREIKYGEAPQYPVTPSKKGYDFVNWSVAEGTPIYANTIIKAEYTPKVYNVEFFDTTGRPIDGYTQKVEYSKPANVPSETELTIEQFNAFLGWHISPESEGTDYKSVDGNMKIYATQAWENANLPIGVSNVTATKDSTALNTNDSTIRYAINVTLTSNGGTTPPGWLMAVLKTQDGRMVASKNEAIRINTPLEIMIDSDESASIVEVVVVGRNGVKTGGALSNLVSAPVTELSGFVPGPWSEWSTVKPTTADEVQEMKQYRYTTRDAATSTSSKTMSGYTYEKTTSTTGSWSAWSDTKYTSSATDAKKREVETRQTVKDYTVISYRYQRAKSPYTYSYWDRKITAGSSGTRASYGYYDLQKNISVSSYNNRTTIATGKKSTGGEGGYNDSGKSGFTISDGGRIYFLKSTNNKTQYRYRDTTYVHHFYKISTWSTWVDNAPSSYYGIEERTLYRYRNLLPVESVVSGTGEIGGETYNIQGTLPADTDFSGRSATIFVYKNTNTDPNEEQREYVGQTTILPGNGYNFSFIPREPITADNSGSGTGDFIVALALEGSAKLTNIDTIKAPRPEYTVTFKSDGVVLGEPQGVIEGNNAVVPSVPEKAGYIFTGWDESPTNISGNRTLTAQFIPKKFVIVLVDFANAEVDMHTDYSYNDELGLPEKSYEGKTFKGWYTLDGNIKKPVQDSEFVVTDHTLLIADWETEEYTVNFVDENENIISSQTVAYGEAAEPPAPLADGDMIFAGWSTDAEWWRVTSDVTVRPIFLYSETVESPSIDFTEEDADEGDNGFDANIPINIFKLSSSTENATIYYYIEGDVLEEQSIVPKTHFAAPIPLSSDEGEMDSPEELMQVYVPGTSVAIFGDVTVTMMAVADGMNDSEVITVEIPFENPMDEYEEYKSKFLHTEWAYALPGDEISLPVYISEVSEIASMNLGLNYDTNVLTLINSEQGDAFEQDNEIGLLVTLTFKVASNATFGDYEILINATAKDSSENNINIESATSVVTLFQDGDCNSDGNVNARDVTRLRRYLAGGWENDSEIDGFSADCNGDDEVDAKDVTRLRRYLAGGWLNDSALE